jgi:hypothetical protein
MFPIFRTFGLAFVFLLVGWSGTTAEAQISLRPWFVGTGTSGSGVVDDFLAEAGEVVQSTDKQRSPKQSQPGTLTATPPTATPQTPRPPVAVQTPRPQDQRPQGNYSDNPQKWGQVYLHLRQGEEAWDMQKLPRRLGSNEFDPVTGKIRWPQAFLAEKYATPRRSLEKLFVARASTGPTPTVATEIHNVIVDMIEMLRADIEGLPANDYVAARKFLDSLDYSVIAPSMP